MKYSRCWTQSLAIFLCTSMIASVGCSSTNHMPIPSALAADKGEDTDSCGANEPLFEILATSALEGAIVPSGYMGVPPEPGWLDGKILGFEVQSYWTPNKEEVLTANAQVQAALKSAGNSLTSVLGSEQVTPSVAEFHRREIGKIVEHIAEYRSQYVGVVVSGKRRILCNFFRKEKESEHFIGARWKCHWVVVDDGGFWFWSIQYDMESHQCEGFRSNGYA